MSEVSDLRNLLAPKSSQLLTGVVTGFSSSGQVSVLTGTRVLTCFSSIELLRGDRVRIQGLVVLSKIDQTAATVPSYRV